MKEEASPRSSVADSSREAAKVMATPSSSARVSSSARSASPPAPALPAKNSVMTEIRVGKRPLQGTKLLVMTAMSRSRGESMIRQPATPAALQPKPMHMVSACLPQALHFLKPLSRS